MATVREKAAALNLSGVPFMHKTPEEAGMANKPFRATFIWSSIISNLQTQVEVKRRRHNLKSYNDCFIGSEAVDVVLVHLTQNQFFGNGEIPRAKVVRVCQTLMDCKVFEAVGSKGFGKEKKRPTFEDSSCSLYRFLNTPSPPVNCTGNGYYSPYTPRSACSTPCRRGEENLYSNTTPNRSKSLEDLLGNTHQPNTTQNAGLSESLVNEVWQEQTLLRLLQLIELPLLDSVLDGSESQQLPLHSIDSDPDILYSSNYLDREILKAFSDSQADEWLSAAVDCLEFLPDQLVVEVSRGLTRCSDEVCQCKWLVFDILVKHYSQPHVSLLSNRLFDIHTGITELLVNGKLQQALEALQLCLKLLDARSREELRRLLRFMAAAANACEVRLNKEVENRMAVKRAFSRAIVHSKNLAKGKVDLLVLFMLDNHKEIFKVPGSLHKLVSDKLATFAQGKDPNVISGTSFCQRITSKAYIENVQRTTNEELWSLLKTIHENPLLCNKEKKRLLGQFYKSHPGIFMQYFEMRIE